MIDAGPRGNMARFINHSCDPNCDTEPWIVNCDKRIGIFANRDIAIDEEFTFNYQLEQFGDAKTKCLCGAANCAGFIGDKAKDPRDNDKTPKEEKSKSKSKSKGGKMKPMSQITPDKSGKKRGRKNTIAIPNKRRKIE